MYQHLGSPFRRFFALFSLLLALPWGLRAGGDPGGAPSWDRGYEEQAFWAYWLDEDNERRRAYIERFKAIAIQEMQRSGVPASIKLAQGILESGDGTSRLATEANNHFGIKCGSAWTGEGYYLEDDDYDASGQLIKSCFRVYRDAKESYIAHSEFLRDPKKAFRYGPLFELRPTDYEGWAYGLKRAGYATNPRYPQLLIGLIEANQLAQYDQMSSLPASDPEFVDEPVFSPGADPFESIYSPAKVFVHNDIKMVFARPGDTPENIANQQRLSVRRLLSYNEMSSADRVFKGGERVYLQPKRSGWRGKTDYHRVQAGESMYDISQLYGIKLAELYKKNRMPMGTQPAIGEPIAIRKRVKADAAPRIRTEVAVEDVASFRAAMLSFVNNIEGIYLPGGNSPTPPSPVPSNPQPVPAPPPSPVPSNPQPVPTTPSPVPSNPQPGNRAIHTVAAGETLFAISRRYNVRVDDLVLWNNLSSTTIKVGQQLFVAP